jgi:uncharacterized protein (TIGR02757 family)
VRLYNHPDFIPSDPVSIPHRFTQKEDIEISGFLTASISWGNRTTILRNASRLIEMLENSPYRFILDASEMELVRFRKFVHRTLQGEDCEFLIRALRRVYREYGGLEPLFSTLNIRGARHAISCFRDKMLETAHFQRSGKHLPDPASGSAAKRINMFLRWMVRKDSNGVDFGLWSTLSPANLICPLDIHSGRIARRFGLLCRNINDWKAAEELTVNLRRFDPADPVKYDFALFGMGIAERRITR